ncbi:MAG TPA: class I adenylate-forming enzyme family protein [Burkholderiaceae bacterium]|jgi:acyl-CoA synthetase (AMP-forming)/AMP-acid ligase II
MFEDEVFLDVSTLIARHALRAPIATALIDGDRRVDYAVLHAQMDRVAASLQRDGLVAGDAIALCAGNSADYLIVFLGALRAGVAVAPLAPSSTPTQLAHMVRDVTAKRFFLDAEVEAQFEKAGQELPAGIPRVRLDEGAKQQRFSTWLALEGSKPAPVAIKPEWPFNVIYSSGTTGAPKGIVQSHAMRWTHIRNASLSGYDSNSVTLTATPLYSNTTLVSVFPTLAMGGAVVLMRKFDAARYLSLAQQHRATHTMLVPVQYQRLLAHPAFDQTDLSASQMKFCTSAPFQAALKADVLRRWPGGLVEYYGMTEGGGTCMLIAHENPDKLHTVGKAIEGHEIRLIDEEGRELPPGSTSEGEVVGRSDAMMSGYHGQPAKTAETEWFDAAGTRFIRTGDVGRFDAEGFLTLLDRRKDVIISGGFNVYPCDIEEVLRGHPAVAEGTVIGVPSPEWGETPAAYVVRRADAQTISEDAIRSFVNERVGKTQRLSAVRFIAELPRSGIGKVLKRELREAWAAGK